MKLKGAFPFLAFTIALVISGCSSSSAPTPTPTPTTIPMKNVEMFYVGDTPTGLKLFSEKYSFQVAFDLTTEALSQLISGKATPLDPDYANLWGSGTYLNLYTKDGTTGIIDLKMGKLNVGAEAETRAIDQLLWTVSTIDPTITGVLLLVDGQPIDSLAGHIDVSKKIMKLKAYNVLNALQISSFIQGATLANPVIISGEACTFEANVLWTLQKDNSVLKSEPTTAQSACPDRSKWSVNLGNLASGNYRFTVEEFSAKDGSLSARDDKSFKVAPK